MSEWKTRITKVQVLKPKATDGEGCLVLIYPPGPDMGRRWPLGRCHHRHDGRRPRRHIYLREQAANQQQRNREAEVIDEWH